MKALGIEVWCMSHYSGNKSIDMAREFQGIKSVPFSVESTSMILKREGNLCPHLFYLVL